MSMINESHLRGALIRLRREAYEKTLEEVAEDLDVSQGYLSQLERGKVETSAVIEELVEALDLSDCRMEVRIDKFGRLTASLTEVGLEVSSG